MHMGLHIYIYICVRVCIVMVKISSARELCCWHIFGGFLLSVTNAVLI